MTTTSLSSTVTQCRMLHDQGRVGDAIDLLDRHFVSEWVREPTYWQWRGALLLWAGRHQKAEQVLRGALVRAEWPMGNPAIAEWLAEVLAYSNRFEEVESITEPWVVKGDRGCTAMHARALLALGRAGDALREARQLVAAALGYLAGHLVLLEAYLDHGAESRASEHGEAVRELVQKIRNMRSLGITFNRFEADKFEKLVGRLERPFGFRRD